MGHGPARRTCPSNRRRMAICPRPPGQGTPRRDACPAPRRSRRRLPRCRQHTDHDRSRPAVSRCWQSRACRTTAEALARAEAAARPALSASLRTAGRPRRATPSRSRSGASCRRLGADAPEVPALADRFVTTIRRDVGTHAPVVAADAGRARGPCRAARRRPRASWSSAIPTARSSGSSSSSPCGRCSMQSSTRRSSAPRSPTRPSSATRCERVGVRPERTLHVGDLYAVDVVGARRAGLHALLLDPFDDWSDDVDCPRSPDVLALARGLLD